jgi:heterotetrameric sarcosine oxidase gamma subunit
MADPCPVARIAPPILTSLRLFRPAPGDVAAAQTALGFALATDAGRWSGTGRARSLRIAPGEWLVREAPAAIDIAARLGGILHHVADLTAGCAAWEVTGPSALTLLSMGGTLDFESWDSGAGARTIFAGIPLIISRLGADGAFEIVCDVSFGAYLDAWLTAAIAGLDTDAPALPR